MYVGVDTITIIKCVRKHLTLHTQIYLPTHLRIT